MFQIFSRVEIWFSLDGERYQSTPIVEEILADLNRESARNVTVKLRGRSGKFVKIKLFFANKWILLSEIAFESGKFLFYFVASDEHPRRKLFNFIVYYEKLQILQFPTFGAANVADVFVIFLFETKGNFLNASLELAVN